MSAATNDSAAASASAAAAASGERVSAQRMCAVQVAAASLFLLITFSQHAIVQQQRLQAQTTRVSERVGFEIEGVNSRFSQAFFAC